MDQSLVTFVVECKWHWPLLTYRCDNYCPAVYTEGVFLGGAAVIFTRFLQTTCLCCVRQTGIVIRLFCSDILKVLFWYTKGQLISKCPFCVFNFFQKTNKNTWHSSKNEFICSFFGRIHGLTIYFRKLSDLYISWLKKHSDCVVLGTINYTRNWWILEVWNIFIS